MIGRSRTTDSTVDDAVAEDQKEFAYPWQPDQGDGTYRNPVLYADYSDPDVIRVEEDYYMVASSFNCTPGLPLLHSRDLVNWKLIGHALNNLPDSHYDSVQPGCGVWAPAIRFHAGKYWIFYPTPDEGIFHVTADHPAGPWSEPHCVKAGEGLIDPCPLWDDDGRAYLVFAYAGSRAGIKHRLRVCPMAPDGSMLLGDGEIVYHDPEKHPTLEGPKFLKKEGWYYILAPAGGVEIGWQLALRSKNIYGPYEDKIVLEQGGTEINGPHQGALVDTPSGSWWFVHFQDADVYGRIVHLQPVKWEEGWPLMGSGGEPVLAYEKPDASGSQMPIAPATSDEFESTTLGLQWQWYANHRNDWYSLEVRPGWLRLFMQQKTDPLNRQPSLLLQKFPARSFNVETRVEIHPSRAGEEAGLVVIGKQSVFFGVQWDGSANYLVFQTDERTEKLSVLPSNTVKLHVSVADGGGCTFGYDSAGIRVSVPCLFQSQKGKWLGAKVGVYAGRLQASETQGYADFNYFRFS